MKLNIKPQTLIRTFSLLIICLGIVHLCFAFSRSHDPELIWFIGTGMAIIFAGLLNIVAIDGGGSKLTKIIGLSLNVFNSAGFCVALTTVNQPQVYFGIIIFLVPAICFAITLRRN